MRSAGARAPATLGLWAVVARTGFVALAANATSVLLFNPGATPVAVTCTFGVDG